MSRDNVSYLFIYLLVCAQDTFKVLDVSAWKYQDRFMLGT